METANRKQRMQKLKNRKGEKKILERGKILQDESKKLEAEKGKTEKRKLRKGHR